MSKEVFAIKQELRINEEITAKVVKLIDDNGAQLGEMPAAEALKVAEEKIIGKIKFTIPRLGYPSVWLYEVFK